MGTGLRISPGGTHIAFSAGTGALVFMDLAAECLLKTIGQSYESSYLQNDFKFVFYIYAASRDHVVGLELLEQIAALQSKFFEFRLVLTNENKDGKLTTQEKIENELRSHGSYSKVWVCGPPVMNELFEKTFSSMIRQRDALYQIL